MEYFYYPASQLSLTITQQPLDVSVTENDTAVFIAQAAGGTAPLSYQWQVSTDGGLTFSNIGPSSSSNSLTLSGVTTSQDGYQYRVVVTDASSNTVTSNPGTLTVIPVSNLISKSLPIGAGGFVTTEDFSGVGS